MSIIKISAQNFDPQVRHSDKPVLFYWGPELEKSNNILLDLEGSFGGLLTFAELDQSDDVLPYQYGFEGAGIAMFNGGEEICRGGDADLGHLSEWVSRAIDVMLSAGGHQPKKSKYVTKRGQQKIQSTVTKKQIKSTPKKKSVYQPKEAPKVPFEKIDQSTFAAKVLQRSGDVLILFCSEAGGLSASAQERIGYQLGRLSYDIGFVRIVAEECPELIKRYQVTQLPSLMLLRDGHIVTAEFGTQPIMLTRWVDIALQYAPRILKDPQPQEHSGKMTLKKARSRFNRLRKADNLGYLSQNEKVEA